eukprot:scaffold95974_cov19-Tisochrysis_lutea.AAC.2
MCLHPTLQHKIGSGQGSLPLTVLVSIFVLLPAPNCQMPTACCACGRYCLAACAKLPDTHRLVYAVAQTADVSWPQTVSKQASKQEQDNGLTRDKLLAQVMDFLLYQRSNACL